MKIGDKVASFKVQDNSGTWHSLEDYIGTAWVLAFYPKASTPGCTAEMCNLNDNLSALQAKGYKVLGVSADTVKKQDNFSKKYEFNFPLLADTEKQLINAFGVWGPKKFMGKEYEGIHRKTFLIDEKGIVKRIIEKVKTKEHSAQILEE